MKDLILDTGREQITAGGDFGETTEKSGDLKVQGL